MLETQSVTISTKLTLDDVRTWEKNWVGNFSRELLEKVPIKITEIKRSQSSGFDLFPLFCMPVEFGLETISSVLVMNLFFFYWKKHIFFHITSFGELACAW